ncbi:MAG: hypothetical protein HYS27_03020 [Deltaproteobacteria bacterium]|nr:hypothetical protein [Deltaproteobacteria bacterium]
MQVQPLAPNLDDDHNLLRGIRSTLHDADEAILCVAFASSAGVHLLRRELEPLRARQGAMLLVTSVFGTTKPEALHLARDAGVDVRVINPSKGTFHPKLYLARRGDRISAVVGSANLTGGLVNNVEMAIRMQGEMRERELALLLAWARELWSSSDAIGWTDDGARPPAEPLSAELFALIDAALAGDPVVRTLGTGAVNLVVERTPHGLYVETGRSRARGVGAELVPGWMIELAWDYLRAHGSLTNKLLLDKDGLNVKRSSFVCALLARLPGVEVFHEPSLGLRTRRDSGT